MMMMMMMMIEGHAFLSLARGRANPLEGYILNDKNNDNMRHGDCIMNTHST